MSMTKIRMTNETDLAQLQTTTSENILGKPDESVRKLFQFPLLKLPVDPLANHIERTTPKDNIGPTVLYGRMGRGAEGGAVDGEFLP